MIALVGLFPEASHAWIDRLQSLPLSPAWKYSGFLIGCSRPSSTVIEWYRETRQSRKYVPIGGIVDPADEFAFSLAESGVHLRPLLRADELLADGRVPTSVLHRLRGAAVEGRIIEAWGTRRSEAGLDDTREVEELLAVAAAVGVSGAGIPTLLARLGLLGSVGRATLYRRFERANLPPPGELLRRARLESVSVRLELGMDRVAACAAAGWSTPQAYANALRRFRVRCETNRAIIETNRSLLGATEVA
jgi:hypothetical protein